MLIGSTLNNNLARRGGGIDNWGTAKVVSSTLSGNLAADGGGGIYNANDGGGSAATLTATNSTIALNQADSNADGVGSESVRRLLSRAGPGNERVVDPMHGGSQRGTVA